MSIADVRGYAVVTRRIVDVLEDGRTVGNGFVFCPGLEGIAQRVHVRVRAYARIAKKIPSAAERLAPFEKSQAALGAILFNLRGSAYAGQARAHNQHVKVFNLHVFLFNQLLQDLHPATPAHHDKNGHE